MHLDGILHLVETGLTIKDEGLEIWLFYTNDANVHILQIIMHY